MEPIELTDPDTFAERLKQGGVITVTRGTFGDAIAHTADCPSLRQVRIPTPRSRYWWTPDYRTAVTTLSARQCEHCLRPRRYPSPFLPRP